MSIILFAIASNMDNIVVGLSYDIRRIHITWSANLVIGLITFLLTAPSPFFFGMILLFWGNQVGKSRLSKLVGDHAEVIANVIMIMLGLYEIFVWKNNRA